jgi:hypothetical protein
MGQHLEGFENYASMNLELNRRFINPIVNSKKSKALKELQKIHEKQDKKEFFFLLGIYFSMMFSGSWGLEMMESLVSFQNSTILDFLKEEPNLQEQNPFLMISVMLLSSATPFLLKRKPKESKEIKSLRNQKKQELEIQGLNMSFQNQQDLKLFFNITKKEKLIKKWLFQEIDNLEKTNQEELKKKLFDSFDNDDFILFINTIQQIASFKLEKNIPFSMPQEIGIVLKLNMDYLEDEKTQ